MKVPRGVVPSYRTSLNITHFVRIPLLNRTSSSQIQETLWQVANDPAAAAIPHLAYQSLQSLAISVAALSLPTEKSQQQAIRLLQELGKQDWQKLFNEAQVAQSKAQTSSIVNPETLGNQVVDQIKPRPLTVDLVGLGESAFQHRPPGLENVMRLYVFMKEPTDILRSFCSGISREFMGAGLERQTPLQGNLGDRRFCQARAIDTKGLSSGVLNTKPSLERFKTYIRPKFDARDLCEKFKDVVWGKDVHLDRSDLNCAANPFLAFANKASTMILQAHHSSPLRPVRGPEGQIDAPESEGEGVSGRGSVSDLLAGDAAEAVGVEGFEDRGRDLDGDDDAGVLPVLDGPAVGGCGLDGPAVGG
ncbi:MAG: hypothetical protein ASARMPREDX12_007550 [Alectoria sarmentosa]|nr:MAG: hypothetical protein ASARMPREDX12_007550 [Alectoria sarmentosa]